MQDFHDMKVWQKAHQIALDVYRATVNFPKGELYGLTNQIRRAAVSVAANIAEGRGRGSDADFARFMQMSMGSSNELEYELLLARDLGYINVEQHQVLEKDILEVKQMLAAFLKKLRANG